MRTAIDTDEQYRLHLLMCDWHQAAVSQNDCIEAVSSLLDITPHAAVDMLNEERSARDALNRFGTEVYPVEHVQAVSEQEPESNLLGSLFILGMFSLAAVSIVLGCVGVLRG